MFLPSMTGFMYDALLLLASNLTLPVRQSQQFLHTILHYFADNSIQSLDQPHDLATFGFNIFLTRYWLSLKNDIKWNLRNKQDKIGNCRTNKKKICIFSARFKTFTLDNFRTKFNNLFLKVCRVFQISKIRYFTLRKWKIFLRFSLL